jgi:hypothetical protein
MKKKGLILIGLMLIIVALWGVAIRSDRYSDVLNGDFFSFWLGGRMIWQGQYPYDQQQWIANHHLFGAEWISDPSFLYPLPLALMFAPLGSLALGHAADIWVILSVLMIIFSAVLLLSLWTSPTKWSLLLPIFAGVFTFRAVLIVLRTAQLGALWLFITALVIWLWKREFWLFGGLLLPLLALKPSLGLPILGLTTVWLFATRSKAALLGMVISSLGLVLIGQLINPAWIKDYLAIGVGKLARDFGYYPNLWGFLLKIFHQDMIRVLNIGISISVLIIAALLIGFVNWRYSLDVEHVMSLIVPVSLLLTPYLWAYDQILLLLPILVVMGQLNLRKFPYLIVASFPICMSVLSLLFLFLAIKLGNDVWSFCLPVVTISLVVLTLHQPFYFATEERH